MISDSLRERLELKEEEAVDVEDVFAAKLASAVVYASVTTADGDKSFTLVGSLYGIEFSKNYEITIEMRALTSDIVKFYREFIQHPGASYVSWFEIELNDDPVKFEYNMPIQSIAISDVDPNTDMSIVTLHMSRP